MSWKLFRELQLGSVIFSPWCFIPHINKRLKRGKTSGLELCTIAKRINHAMTLAGIEPATFSELCIRGHSKVTLALHASGGESTVAL